MNVCSLKIYIQFDLLLLKCFIVQRQDVFYEPLGNSVGKQYDLTMYA